MNTTWSKIRSNRTGTTYVADAPSRAAITPGIDGGWTLNRDVTEDVDLENFPTLAEAMAAA